MYLHAISRILIALYFSRLLVFSHKKFGLHREPLMLLDYYQKKLEFLVYIKVSKGNKVGWHNPSTDPSARRHAANAAHYWILDLSATCIGSATSMVCPDYACRHLLACAWFMMNNILIAKRAATAVAVHIIVCDRSLFSCHWVHGCAAFGIGIIRVTTFQRGQQTNYVTNRPRWLLDKSAQEFAPLRAWLRRTSYNAKTSASHSWTHGVGCALTIVRQSAR